MSGPISLSGRRTVQPVVYSLWKKGVVIYVGSSNCIRERLHEHKHMLADRVTYVCFDKIKDARDHEQSVIRLLLPAFNKRLRRTEQLYGSYTP